MLSQLYIKNIAVISEAVIDFGPRFNVFTGETGAKRFWFRQSTAY